MTEVIQKQIIEDIKHVAQKLHTKNLSRADYLANGKYSAYQIYDNGMNWNILCNLAGIESKVKKAVSDEKYFQNLTEAVKILGRYPLSTERKKFGLNFSKRRYPNLNSFIEKAIEKGIVPDLNNKKEINLKSSDSFSEESIVYLIKNALKNRVEEDRKIPPIPLKTRRKKWERTDISGFPYAPQEEQGVLVVFSIFCHKGILPWQIIDVNSGRGIDVICYDDKNQREIHVELKYLLTRGNWNHPYDDFDYLVCWENRWPDFPRKVIELSKLVN